MSMLISTLTAKGQTTIPQAARNAFPLKVGRRLSWEVHGDFLLVRPVRDIQELSGSMKSDQPPISIEEMKKATRESRALRLSRKYGEAWIAYILDANVLVRFLTHDDPKQGKAATKLLLKAANREVTLHLEASIIAEVVYVLESTRYNKARHEIHDALIDLVQNPGIEVEAQDMVIDTLRRFKAHPALDFQDCLIAAVALSRNMPVASFDRDLDRFKDIQRHEPGE